MLTTALVLAVALPVLGALVAAAVPARPARWSASWTGGIPSVNSSGQMQGSSMTLIRFGSMFKGSTPPMMRGM